MTELLLELLKLVIVLSIAYCFYKAHDSRLPPFRRSVCNFIFAIIFIFSMFIITVEIEKVFCGALGCQFTMIGAVHLITNDREKFEKDPKIWVNSMSILMGITGILAMLMDYPNTKSTLYLLIIGFATRVLGSVLDPRRGKEGKEENL